MRVVLLGTALAASAACTADEAGSRPAPDVSVAASQPVASAPPSSQGPSGPVAAEEPTRLPERLPALAEVHRAVLGDSAAGSRQERAVAAAWMAYWQATLDSYYRVQPSPALDRLARGSALTDVLDYVAELRSRQDRTVGWMRFDLTAVTVAGGRAAVVSCVDNHTVDVDRQDRATETPDVGYDFSGALRRDAQGWLVTAVTGAVRDRACEV